MRIRCVGGGPAGLLFASFLKRDDPNHDIVVYERAPVGHPQGFGLVLSRSAYQRLWELDPETLAKVAHLAIDWDEIEINVGRQRVVSGGHAYSGMPRSAFLAALRGRCIELGVTLRHQDAAADGRSFQGADVIVGADGANSQVRLRGRRHFTPTIDWQTNRFIWLGSSRPLSQLTFYFKQTSHGLWRVHAYPYGRDASAFIVECTEETWRAAGMDRATPAASVAFCETVLQDELQAHRLRGDGSGWRRFPTVRNERWSYGNVVLIGDAAHTTHFSIGSGTKLAAGDAASLAKALSEADVQSALAAYERDRRPAVHRAQLLAEDSKAWFERTEAYIHLEPKQFASSLLNRSMPVTHERFEQRRVSA